MTGIPEKLAQNLKEFFADMEALGIPCTVTCTIDGRTLLDTVAPSPAPAPSIGFTKKPVAAAAAPAAAPAGVVMKTPKLKPATKPAAAPAPVVKPKKEHVKLPLLNMGQMIKYTNPENKGFFGKTATVILHRGAMAHLDFGKDGTCWGHRRYCEVLMTPAKV